jgi:hypothetical protein
MFISLVASCGILARESKIVIEPGRTLSICLDLAKLGRSDAAPVHDLAVRDH